jgi:hypothetical protein
VTDPLLPLPPPEGQRARETAIAASCRGVDADWIARALLAVQTAALGSDTFTTDDLWAYVELPREPRAMGAIMIMATKAGFCEASDRTVKSTRPNCHRRPLRIWKSLLRGAT